MQICRTCSSSRSQDIPSQRSVHSQETQSVKLSSSGSIFSSSQNQSINESMYQWVVQSLISKKSVIKSPPSNTTRTGFMPWTICRVTLLTILTFVPITAHFFFHLLLLYSLTLCSNVIILSSHSLV